MKESSELGTTSDLVVVHTLICSLQGVTEIGLRNQTKLTLSFKMNQHSFCGSASFHFLETSIQMPFIAQNQIVKALKLSSYSLKLKLIGVNVEEILTGLELRCIQRHLIVGQQTEMTSRSRSPFKPTFQPNLTKLRYLIYICKHVCC